MGNYKNSSDYYLRAYNQINEIVSKDSTVETMKGLELEFYSRERKQFFNVLKLALNYNVSDLDTSICSLRDLYLGLIDGGLD